MPNTEGSKRNFYLFILVAIAIASSALITTIFFSHKNLSCKPGQLSDYDKAVCQALILYNQQKSSGSDFSSGPCLSNDLFPGWVADIVHNPRERQDDLPANQCQAFIEGRATHFVELDTKGNVVRVE